MLWSFVSGATRNNSTTRFHLVLNLIINQKTNLMRIIKTITTVVVLSLFMSSTTFAQKGKDNPKYTNYYADVEEPIETKEVTLAFTNGVSRVDFMNSKLNLRIIRLISF